MKRKAIPIILSALIILSLTAVYLMYIFNFIPHKKYDNSDFGITAYISPADKDSDGTDDQTDILNGARKYVSRRPKYKSKYYSSGYPDDNYGVCTDVVAFALKSAGYDLMELLSADIEKNPAVYGIEKPDKSIDFRRVKNLRVYFERTAVSLTCDVSDIREWQGGDIVVFKKHRGLVSDKRNKTGVPFVIHHASPLQRYYEEDILERRNDITGHYRIG